ncbi:MKRN2 ligase, partial [Locustella ochotensis]|nr:MKRN2 ligase [Locustella ochotensis]
RYYLQGVCREGSKCLFSHDLATSKSSTICKYYQKGQCAYGSRCRCSWKGPGEAGGSWAAPSLPPARPRAHFWGLPAPPGAAPLRPGAEESPRDGKKGELGELPCSGRPWGSHGAPSKELLLLCLSRERGWRCSAAAPGGELAVVLQAAACGFSQFVLITGWAAAHSHSSLEVSRGKECLWEAGADSGSVPPQMCMATFEHDMERAFAIQASQDKVCSICMEVVYEKPSASERRFGILSNCTHTYCLSCIRQWRCAKQFENPIIKSCPECRVISEFVIPSVYWVEEQEKKNELIEAFKQGVGKKPCKYFEQGKGTCPFGGKCLYLHAYPDGTRAEPEKPRKQLSSEGTVRFFNSVRLWDFIEDRESRSAPGADGEVTELGELFMHLSGAEEE